MILPNTFDTTPFKLSNLSKRQKYFIAFLYEQGHDDPTEVVFKRNYLKNIANAWGAEWAPAWIVKDMSRVTTRGFYAIPELVEYIEVNAQMVSVDDAVAVPTDTDVNDVVVTITDDDSLIVSDDMVGDMDEALSVSDDMLTVSNSQTSYFYVWDAPRKLGVLPLTTRTNSATQRDSQKI